MKKRREVFHLHVRGDVGTPLHTAIMNYCAEHDLTNQEFMLLAVRSLLFKELFDTLAIKAVKTKRGDRKRRRTRISPPYKTLEASLHAVMLNAEYEDI